MSEIDSENEGIRSGMSVVAEGSLEAPEADINRMLAAFTDDEIVVRDTTDTHSGERRTVEIQVGEGETLLQFHEACNEQEIRFSIERLYRQ